MVSLLAILGTHEMGHYLVSRHHGVESTLPYFIPMPIGLGTMGAFINMKGIPRNRDHLMDIGAAGPLAGFIVALIVLVIGLRLSVIDIIPLTFPEGYGAQIEGNSILYLALKYFSFGMLLPQPAAYATTPILHWLQYFITGQPSPFGATDVMLSPVAWAGWVGILVTSLNLIPAGTLDGGHISQTLFGKRATRTILPVVLGILVLLGMVWNGWWLWAAMIFFLVGRVYAEPLDQITPLSKNRKVIGILCIILFLITFTPVPFSLIF
jgi:membrane-associated protease RseP (regulator of RpoE activity)